MASINDVAPEEWDEANRNWMKSALCAPNPHAIKEVTPAKDKQVAGSHYKDCKIQPIEYIQANKLGYEEGNVVKYITRYKDKGGVDDLLKAIHYIDLIIEDIKERR